MKFFEYFVATLENYPDRETYLDRLGQHGWELVSVTLEAGREHAYLKRPLAASPQASARDVEARWCIDRTQSASPETWCGSHWTRKPLCERSAMATSRRLCEACVKAMAGALLTKAGINSPFAEEASK
jgi:hypothetical protein